MAASGPLSGVNIMLDGLKTSSTTTDANGNYTFSGLQGGSYTVTPAMAKLKFTPPTRFINKLTQDWSADFSASDQIAVYKISGRVMDASQPLAGIKVLLEGSKLTSTTTNANGNYTFSDLRAGGSYTVTPATSKRRFTPPSRFINKLTQDWSADFSGLGQIAVYKISGRVMDESQPLAGVKVRLEGSKLTSTTTDANGNYTFSDLRAGGNYTITAVKEKMNFTPPGRFFKNLSQDGSASFSRVGKEGCADADKSREKLTISERFSAGWRRKIEAERTKIIAENSRAAVVTEATLGAIEYQSAFPKGCQATVVTLSYTWQIKTGSAVAPPKVLRVPKEKIFGCIKVLGSWVCNY
jgi:hypothetical protein